MNKYQYALNDLINQNYDDIEILQELVDKETPFKPTNKRPCFSEEGVIWGNCKCGNEIDYIKYLRDVNYCSNCGQLIDWSD